MKRMMMSAAALPMLLATHCDRGQHNDKPVCRRDPAVVQYVDSLPYKYQDMGPAMEAYRAIAADCGWPADLIEARSEFVGRVMYGESGGCWNILGGTRNWTGEGCLFRKWGRNSDAGFGQVTDILRRGLKMCDQMGICNRWDSVKSPSESMYTYVLALNNGKGPWCYVYKGRKSMHLTNGDCATWPG